MDDDDRIVMVAKDGSKTDVPLGTVNLPSLTVDRKARFLLLVGGSVLALLLIFSLLVNLLNFLMICSDRNLFLSMFGYLPLNLGECFTVVPTVIEFLFE